MSHPTDPSPGGPAGGPDAIRAAITLALWSASWQVGASADRVLTVLAHAGSPSAARADGADAATRSGLPGPGEPTAGTLELLALLRRGGPAALVLPIPGDLRGLSPGGDSVLPALDAGAIVVLPEAGVGLIPVPGHWRAFANPPPHPTLPVSEVTALVDGAVAEATRALRAADVASGHGDPREAVRREILAGAVDAPRGMPAAACSLLARATTVAALLEVAGRHDTAAVTSHQIAAVDDALSPLRSAVREAYRSAVAATVAAVLSRSGEHPSPEASAVRSRLRGH